MEAWQLVCLAGVGWGWLSGEDWAMKNMPPPVNVTRARALRLDPTDAEKAMWRLLRAQFADWRFRRQVPLGFSNGDFASHRARVVIGIDGGQHGGSDDAARDAMMGREGYRVLRFWNSEVLGNLGGVARVSAGVLEGSPPYSPPSNLR